MNTADQINVILKRIAENEYTDTDIQYLRQLLISNDSQSLKQLNKFNINIGLNQTIHIHDKTYDYWNDKAIEALIQAVCTSQEPNLNPEYFRTIEACSDRQSLQQYFECILPKLQQIGDLKLDQNVFKTGILFNNIAKLSNLKLGRKNLSEAFFMFSEFSSIKFHILQQYSSQCLQIAKQNTKITNNSQNLSYICFAIAIVDNLDKDTKNRISSIEKTNLVEDNIDSFWYKIPIVYELSEQQLHFYKESSEKSNTELFIQENLSYSEDLQQILDRVTNGQYTEADIDTLRQFLSSGDREVLQQFSKYNVNIGEGRDIHIGDRVYQQLDEEAIQALVKEIQKVRWRCVASLTENDYTQVELQSVGIPLIDKLAKNLTDISQQSVMRYGLKLAFSPNPNLEYFIKGGNQVIQRWQKRRNNWAIHQEIAVKGNVDLWFTSVAISPDGRYMAACKVYQIIIWRLGEEKALHTFSKTPFSNFFDVSGFDSVSFSPDGKLLAANDNKDVKIWDIETGKEITKLSGHSDKVTGVVFNPKNARVLASCSYDKTIKIWDITQQRCLGTLSAHRDAVYTLAFSPDGNILASGSNDNTIKLWNLDTREALETLRDHSDAVTCLVFSPDTETLISGSNDGSIIEWKISGEKLLTFSQRHPRGVTSLAISPDGETLMSGGRDQTIKVWRR